MIFSAGNNNNNDNNNNNASSSAPNFYKPHTIIAFCVITFIFTVAATATDFARKDDIEYKLFEACYKYYGYTYCEKYANDLAETCPKFFHLTNLGKAGGIIGCISLACACLVNLVKRLDPSYYIHQAKQKERERNGGFNNNNNNNNNTNNVSCHLNVVPFVGTFCLSLNILMFAMAAAGAIAAYLVPPCKSSSESLAESEYAIGPCGILFILCFILAIITRCIESSQDDPVVPENNNNGNAAVAVGGGDSNQHNNNNNWNNQPNNFQQPTTGFVVAGQQNTHNNNNNGNYGGGFYYGGQQQQQQQPQGYYNNNNNNSTNPNLAFGSAPPPPPPPTGYNNNHQQEDHQNYMYNMNAPPNMFVGFNQSRP